MKLIPLSQGKCAMVDDEDFERVSQYKWRYWSNKRNEYAQTHVYRNGKRTTIKLHSFIMQPPKGVWVDHIDRNGLNCTRLNMRYATRSENRRNTCMRADNCSGFRGVSFEGRARKWKAQIGHNGRNISLGYYATPEAAAHAYDKAATKLHGAFATLNNIDGLKGAVA